jgi:integrase
LTRRVTGAGLGTENGTPRLSYPHHPLEASPAMPHVMTLPQRHQAVDCALLPDLFELYLSAKQSDSSITPLTATIYRGQVAPFMAWFNERADKQLSPDLLAQFVAWMRTDYRTRYGTTPAANTSAHCVTRLRTFFNWCYKQNCTGGVNLADWLPTLKKRGSRLYFPDGDEMQRLFDAVTGIERLRDWAVFAFLLSTGARLYEVACAEVGNIEWQTPPCNLRLGDDHRGSIWLRKVKFDSEGEGPGRQVVFCSTAGLLLKVWLRADDRAPDATLFGLSDSGISQIVKRHAQVAKLPELSPHAFRRMFADHWDEVHGMTARTVLKRQLGHSLKGDVTQDSYISRNHRRVTAEIMKWHVSPLANLAIRWETLPIHMG